MKDSNITKLSSLALEKVNSSDPYTTNAPSDGTLALGSIQTTDIPNIINNENYNPAIPVVPGQDNDKIKDGTIFFNRDDQQLQFFNNGAPLNVAGTNGKASAFTLDTDSANITEGKVLVFSNTGDAVHLKAAALKADAFAANDKSFILHENRRIKLRAKGIKSTVNPSTISNLGYIQFSNNTDQNSEGFVYLDGSPTIILQHQTSSGSTPYSNVCTTFTGGAPGESSTSVNAILEINSTEGGFLPSRLTTAQISALSVNSLDKGLIVYNSDTGKLNMCDGTAFNQIPLSVLKLANAISTGNIPLSSTLPIPTNLTDGVTLSVLNNNAILLTQQTNGSENGFYNVTSNGLVSSTDQPVFVYAFGGAVNQGKLFYNNQTRIGNNSPFTSLYTPMIGDIKHSTLTADHNGWLKCDGRTLYPATYPALFSAIGIRYGTGTGAGNFAIPNAIGRVLAAANPSGTPAIPAGTLAGQDSTVLSTNQLPGHTHGTSALSTNSAGAHIHGTSTLSTTNNGDHFHGIKWTADAGASGTARPDINGTGSNIVSTMNAGAHTHSITGNTDSAGAHTHSITGNTDSAGLGNAIDNRQSTLYIDNVFIYAGFPIT